MVHALQGTQQPLPVMAGLVPAIHDLELSFARKDVDARDKAGHDEFGMGAV
jgi:hypothetical protein